MSSFGFAALAKRTRLVTGVALMLSVSGALAWVQMPREEDPRLAERFGLLVAPLPGADAEEVERLVVSPLEDEIAEVDEVLSVRTTIRASVAIFRLELTQEVTDTDRAWDRVEEAIEEARREMPAAALPPRLQHNLVETEAVLVALHGLDEQDAEFGDVLALADLADALKSELLRADDVADVVISGDPGDEIAIEYDEGTARQLQLPPERLSELLAARNVNIPGGAVRLGARRVELRPEGEMADLDELAATPITLPSGASVPLSSIARVRRMPAQPRAERARFEGQDAVFVGAVPAEGVQSVELGERIRVAIADFQERHPQVQISEVAYQPDHVSGRLAELGNSLLLGIAIVALVLFLTMGFRLGFVVASVVPLVTFASLSLYATAGGVLHQMAVAALVLALGLLVDNAIVMAEAVQRRLDQGERPADAALGATRELAVPLASATATTLASFVPMLLAPGGVGEFTRAIPVVVMTTLAVSYAYAVLVTPLFGAKLLRPTRNKAPENTTGTGRLEGLAAWVASVSVRRPWLTLAGILLVVGASASFATQVQRDFFPTSDRAQLVVAMEMPEGTHLEATSAAAEALERVLGQRSDVQSVSAFVGRSVPAFYYNLPRLPSAPNLAQLIVSADSPAAVREIQDFVRDYGAIEMPGAVIVPRRLEQGPPITAPVEIRLKGDDLEDLRVASDAVLRALRADRRALAPRSDQGPGAPVLSYTVDDARAAQMGLARANVAYAMLGRTDGLPVSTYRGGRQPAPIVLRAPQAVDHSPAELDAIALHRGAGDPQQSPPPVQLSELAQATLDFVPAVIHHHDGRRSVSVLSEVAPGATYAQIVSELQPQLEAMDFPSGVTWDFGGAIESSAKANRALGAKGGVAMVLLIVILLMQFDSFRRVFIVLITAPLAVMGIWPGLFIADLPFGFVALMGAIALIGIVVNGAIVLLDLTERRREEGASIEEALRAAVTIRTRPILLTATTTVAGLTPLLFSKSTLWPPMASAMISGLTMATLLTLFAVPALYRLLFRDPKARSEVKGAATAHGEAVMSAEVQP